MSSLEDVILETHPSIPSTEKRKIILAFESQEHLRCFIDPTAAAGPGGQPEFCALGLIQRDKALRTVMFFLILIDNIFSELILPGILQVI